MKCISETSFVDAINTLKKFTVVYTLITKYSIKIVTLMSNEKIGKLFTVTL